MEDSKKEQIVKRLKALAENVETETVDAKEAVAELNDLEKEIKKA